MKTLFDGRFFLVLSIGLICIVIVSLVVSDGQDVVDVSKLLELEELEDQRFEQILRLAADLQVVLRQQQEEIELLNQKIDDIHTAITMAVLLEVMRDTLSNDLTDLEKQLIKEYIMTPIKDKAYEKEMLQQETK